MRTVFPISLPAKVARELDRFAKSQGRNKSDVVKESISVYLWDPGSLRREEALARGQRRKDRSIRRWKSLSQRESAATFVTCAGKYLSPAATTTRSLAREPDSAIPRL